MRNLKYINVDAAKFVISYLISIMDSDDLDKEDVDTTMLVALILGAACIWAINVAIAGALIYA